MVKSQIEVRCRKARKGKRKQRMIRIIISKVSLSKNLKHLQKMLLTSLLRNKLHREMTENTVKTLWTWE